MAIMDWRATPNVTISAPLLTASESTAWRALRSTVGFNSGIESKLASNVLGASCNRVMLFISNVMQLLPIRIVFSDILPKVLPRSRGQVDSFVVYGYIVEVLQNQGLSHS